jgi:hypothetical protein
MTKRTRDAKELRKPLDTVSGKRGRGRPGIRPSLILGRAESCRTVLDQVWDRLWPLLSQARSEQGVTDAFLEGAKPYAQDFVPNFANLILRVLREPKFPKRREPQITFLADSLAGFDSVTPRSARDICQKERTRRKRAHHILRWEVYVECSCGYRGQSRNQACQQCGTKIEFGFAPMFSAIS